jgi:invasion protein IalB
MRTTSRRAEPVRRREIDALVAEWPRIPEEELLHEPRAATADAEQEPRRRVGARWERPDAEGGFDDAPFEPRRRGRMRWIAVIVLVVVAGLLAGTLAIAQQTGKARPAAAQSDAVPAAASAGGEESAISDRTVMGDWVFDCVNQERPGAKLCFIRQQLADSKTKAPIFTWTVGQDAKGNLVAVWQTPTGVLIGQGLLFDIGMEKPIPVPYRACTRGQCQAVANLAPDFIDRLAKAGKARAMIVAATGKGLAFDFSVQGLAEGLAALRKN